MLRFCEEKIDEKNIKKIFLKGLTNVWNCAIISTTKGTNKEENKMLALAIFGIIFAAYMLVTLVTIIAWESLPMDRTPNWLEKVHEIVTFEWCRRG